MPIRTTNLIERSFVEERRRTKTIPRPVKSMKGEARIIPVKLDDCLMPAVLLQTLYIDYSGYGPENAIRQMVDVISGASTYRPDAPAAGFHNVRAHLSQASGKVTLEFRAHAYMEPHLRHLILLDNEESDLSWAAPGEGMFESGFNVDVSMDDGRKVNALLMALCSLPRTNPGNLPRLLLAWVCTEAVRTQGRVLILGDSVSGFMRKLDIYSTSGEKYTRLRR